MKKQPNRGVILSGAKESRLLEAVLRPRMAELKDGS